MPEKIPAVKGRDLARDTANITGREGKLNVLLRNLFITQNQMYDFKSLVPKPAWYPVPASL